MTKIQGQFGRERIVIPTNRAGTTGYASAKQMNLDLHLISYIKINSQSVIDLNVKSENTEENIREKNLCDCELKIS